MNHRRRPKRPDNKQRVTWSEAEQNVLIRRALELRAERPDLAGLPLLRQAMLALPVDRRRHILASQQARWFEPGMAAAVKAEEDARQAGPELEDWRARNLEFARLGVQLLEEVCGRADGLARSIVDLAAETREMLRLHRDWMTRQGRMDELFDGILAELRIQTELFSHLLPDAPCGPPPTTADAPSQGRDRPHPETANGDRRPSKTG